MDETIKRNLAKIAMWGALAWASWRIIKGVEKKQTTSQIVKETVKPITDAADTVKKVTKKFLKGSPEAKEYMRKLRSMPRKKKPATDSEIIKTNNLTGKEAERVKLGKPSLKKNLKSRKFKEFFWKW